jgi:hypothetical protein
LVYANSQVADNAVIRSSRFADAALFRSRGTFFVAAQRMSSIQPFIGVVLSWLWQDHQPYLNGLAKR